MSDEARSWKKEGLDVVVSLLTREEQDEFGLLDEQELSEKLGVQFVSLPIADLGVPSSREEAMRVLSRIEKLLTAGKKVGVHCRQSIGRSGMIAAALLVMSGSDPHEAFTSVSSDRGLPVPETEAQRKWVIELAREFEPTASQR